MKKKNRKKLLMVLIVILVASLACGVSSNEGNLETAAAETVAVELTNRAQTAQAETQAAADSPLMTATFTSIPTGTPIPAATLTPTSEVECDLIAFVSDVTVPDGSDFIPGESFTKTWRLKNVGSCPWTTAYDLVFFNGEQMSGVVSQPLINSGSVEPNQTVDVSVDLIAPLSGGNYTGNWKLRNDSNVVFELTSGDPFYVEIDVIEPTPTTGFIFILTPVFVITPNFTIGYAGHWSCGANTKVSFQIENTGILNLESMYIKVEGPVGTYLNANTQNKPFHSTAARPHPECVQSGSEFLATGDSAYVNTTIPGEPLPGTSGKVVINMCGLDDQGGFCKELTYIFFW